MILEDHAKYHDMGPKDVGLKEAVKLQVARTTDHTGEQFAFEIPIYPDDSREQVRDRVNFFLSIMHDRVEDVNQAMLESREKELKINHLRKAIENNNQRFVNQTKALEKRLKRKAIKQAEFDEELAKLQAELKEANELMQKELESLGEKHEPALPQAASSEGLEVVKGE